MHDSEHDPSSDDLDIEVSALPQRHAVGERPAVTQGVWASVQSPRGRAARLVFTGCILVLAMALLVGSLPSMRQAVVALLRAPTPVPIAMHIPTPFPTPLPPLPTPTLYPTPTPAPPMALGAVPQNCPSGPTPEAIGPNGLSGIGASPVWVFVFQGPHATLHLAGEGSHTQYGWSTGFLLAIGPNYSGPVTLRGGDLADGYPLWFGQVDVGVVPLVAPRVDPMHPELSVLFGTVFASDGKWEEWATDLYLPGAGCYYLEATWPGGAWHLTFAAGR
jgi:hypothetical protein